MQNYHTRNMAKLFTAIVSVSITGFVFASETEPAITALGNATYNGIEDVPVTLSEGLWEGSPYLEGGASRPRVGLLEDMYFTGDLDGDGREDTIALLWQSSGGTGSNIYIAAMRSENGGYVNTSTTLLGDRIKIRDGKIESGRIILDVLQTGEHDAMCCPTQFATRTWIMEGNQLQESEMQVTGDISLKILEENEWLLTRLNHAQPVPDDATVTLSFNAGRISGISACNRYSADIREGDNPGDIIIGPALGTRMACPDNLMEIESLYLESLARVTNFSFHAGGLALSGQHEDGAPFTMLFLPVGAESK